MNKDEIIESFGNLVGVDKKLNRQYVISVVNADSNEFGDYYNSMTFRVDVFKDFKFWYTAEECLYAYDVDWKWGREAIPMAAEEEYVSVDTVWYRGDKGCTIKGETLTLTEESKTAIYGDSVK